MKLFQKSLITVLYVGKELEKVFDVLTADPGLNYLSTIPTFLKTEIRFLLLIKETSVHFLYFPNQLAEVYDLSENVGRTSP